MKKVLCLVLLAGLVLLPFSLYAKRECARCAEKKAPACNRFTFDATSSYDPDNTKLSYLWDFGDGTASAEPVVTHVYEKGGTYTVTLSVTDASDLECNTHTTTQSVKVNTAPICVFTMPDGVCIGDTVTMDASSTQDEDPASLSYVWDFGDGTSGEGRVVTKKYDKTGTYRVRLSVDDNAGSPCSTCSLQKTITVNAPPQAQAGEDIDMCIPANQEYRVTLSAGAAGADASYTWDFGDGESASGRSVTHTYAKGGTYTARLIVDDGRGSPCSSMSDTVNIRLSKQPAAIIKGESLTCVGSTISFDGSSSLGSDENALNYRWDFGDGATAEGATVSHAYQKDGTYKVILTVDNGQATKCSASSTMMRVVVSSAPVASLSNIETACVGDKVSFDATGTIGDSLSYTWDFGDGTTVEGGSRQTHVYSKGGKYTVRVTVDDRKGTPCSSDSTTSAISINTPPVADAGPNLVCCTGVESVFDGSKSYDADGDALTYMWDFGDGATGEGAKVSHVYTKGGKYRVRLNVDDNSGTSCSSASSSFEARVNETPVSVIKVR